MSLLHHVRHFFLPHESNNQRAKILHPSSVGMIIAVFIFFQYLLNQTTSVFPQILGFASQIPVQEIIRLTNLERTSRGLPELKLNSELSIAAGKKAADMFARNYWAHVSPIGTQPWYFITEAGYQYRYAGENLARDFSDSSSVVKAWIASPAHKDNLLSNRYQDIGVAVVDGSLDGHETTLVVQMFGTRVSISAPPAVSKTASFTVSAAEPDTIPEPTLEVSRELPVEVVGSRPVLSAFALNRLLTIGLLGIFALVLFLDILIVKQKSLIRWTSKSFAHLVFVVLILIAATTVIGGKIL